MHLFKLKAETKKCFYMSGDDGEIAERFTGKVLPKYWGHPEIHLYQCQKPIHDFIHWSASVPVLSERAWNVLSSLISPSVQELDFMQIYEVKLYFLNVLEWLEIPSKHAPIFKLKDDPSVVWVNMAFKKLVASNDLTGAIFEK